MADAAAPNAPGGANDDVPLPAESILRRQIEEGHRMSVVRLRIAQLDDNQSIYYGRTTGFIAFSRTGRLVVMTCGHAFRDWAQGTQVQVTFHDHQQATAQHLFLCIEREVALLAVDTSSDPELLNPAKYPPVDFSYDDFRKGDFLVMLGYPYPTTGYPDLANFAGYVTNESAPIPTEAGHVVHLISGDYPTAPGASGSPVFGRDGRMAGIAIGGSKDMAYTLSVRWIRGTLVNAMDEATRGNVVNQSIGDMIGLLLVSRQGPAAGAGPSSSGGSDAQASPGDPGSSHA